MNSEPAGAFEIEVETSPPFVPARPILAGERWSFQAGYRYGSASNFTDAVRMTFE